MKILCTNAKAGAEADLCMIASLGPNSARGLAHHWSPSSMCWASHPVQYFVCQLAFLSVNLPLDL